MNLALLGMHGFFYPHGPVPKILSVLTISCAVGTRGVQNSQKRLVENGTALHFGPERAIPVGGDSDNPVWPRFQPSRLPGSLNAKVLYPGAATGPSTHVGSV